MADSDNNGQKRAKEFNPADNLPVPTNTFTSELQPSSDAKKEGWRKLRAKRLLTQKIIEKLTEGATLEEYVQSLILNAKSGNSKAIETINKGLEDEIIKIAQTDSEGNDIDYSKYSDEELRTLAALQSKSGTGTQES